MKCGVSGGVSTTAALALRAVAAVFPASNPRHLPCRCLSARLFSHHIITEGNASGASVSPRQTCARSSIMTLNSAHQTAKGRGSYADGNGNLDFADHQLKKRPLVGRQNAILSSCRRFSSAMRCSSGESARDRHAGCDTPALSPGFAAARRINHHTQHIVACDELVPCFLSMARSNSSWRLSHSNRT